MPFIKLPSMSSAYDYQYWDIGKDKTWRTCLGHIEAVLDHLYNENDDKLCGIKLELEIVDTLPDDCEMEEQ